MINICKSIQNFNLGRDQDRLEMKYRKMRSNAFVFMRGTCHLFYDRLPREKILDRAPLTWCCGDLHLENFGSYKGDNRLAYFDINDFDEAALAPLTWDLVRLVSSILIGSINLGVTKKEASFLSKTFLESYRISLVHGKSYWIERETAIGKIRVLLDNVRERTRADFLNKRTKIYRGKRQLKIDGQKALPVSSNQFDLIHQFMSVFAKKQVDPTFFEPIDVAKRIAGTGSLGVERYIILINGKGHPDGNYLLDLKEALPSSLIPHLTVKQPKWKTESFRTVELQHRMQAVSMAFLQPVKIKKTDYILRALQPSEDRIILDRSVNSLNELEQILQAMGNIVASAHIRSAGRNGSAIADELVEFGQNKLWGKQLLKIADECAQQIEKDWKTYCCAFDDGFFNS
ncbi:DUF2252 domain-containing protein [Undibacterium sp. Jales W-56]|uniref:DUF2252 domain-containing protein n=1 Tax=Undibacterium sp. Jales W-56 TaxID=2897325 RepID=UPI0021CF985E|nr:DUF2252 domain-containing protein [Undibacterium sp. Jales W-56]MCU6435479.1 DUF2252 domain-containing protein [Undibacterium sp. Jales W-56]